MSEKAASFYQSYWNRGVGVGQRGQGVQELSPSIGYVQENEMKGRQSVMKRKRVTKKRRKTPSKHKVGQEGFGKKKTRKRRKKTKKRRYAFFK